MAIPICPSGQFLTSSDGATLSCADLTQIVYACPPGYTATTVSETFYPGPTCRKAISGCPQGAPTPCYDEMVKAGDFWIDRFETATCGSGNDGQATGYLNATSGITTSIGCSVRNVVPKANVTWFQLAQMCANEGKHLCTNAEWQTAVTGTPEPGGDGGATGCNVASNLGQGTSANNNLPLCTATGTPACTMAHSNCVSAYGAYDMIGNVWEYAADWGQAGPVSTSFGQGAEVTKPWGSGFQGDTWNINGQAAGNSGWVTGLPAAFIRGGSWINGSAAGAFALFLGYAPAYTGANGGARCCAGGR